MATALAYGPEFDFHSQNPFETRLVLEGIPLGAKAFMGDLVRWASHAYLPAAGPKAGSLLSLLLNAWHMAAETSPSRLPEEIPLGLRSSELATRLGIGSRRALSRAYEKLCELGLAVEVEPTWAQDQNLLSERPCSSGYREGKRFTLRLDKITEDFKGNALEAKARAARQRSWEAFENTSASAQQNDAESRQVIEPSIPGPQAPITSRPQSIKKDPYTQGNGRKPNGRFISPDEKARILEIGAILKIQAVLDGHGLVIANREKYKYSPPEFVALRLAQRGWGDAELDEMLYEISEEGGVRDPGRLLFCRLQMDGGREYWAAEGQRLRALNQARLKTVMLSAAREETQRQAAEYAEYLCLVELDGRLRDLDQLGREELCRLAEANYRHYKDFITEANPYPKDLVGKLGWWKGFLSPKNLLDLAAKARPSAEDLEAQARQAEEDESNGWAALKKRLGVS